MLIATENWFITFINIIIVIVMLVCSLYRHKSPFGPLEVAQHFWVTRRLQQVGYQWATRRYIPEEVNLHYRRCENVKAYVNTVSL
jgi:hypothetical protein